MEQRSLEQILKELAEKTSQIHDERIRQDVLDEIGRLRDRIKQPNAAEPSYITEKTPAVDRIYDTSEITTLSAVYEESGINDRNQLRHGGHIESHKKGSCAIYFHEEGTTYCSYDTNFEGNRKKTIDALRDEASRYAKEEGFDAFFIDEKKIQIAGSHNNWWSQGSLLIKSIEHYRIAYTATAQVEFCRRK